MTTNEEYIRKNKVVTVDDDKNTKLHYAAAVNNFEQVEKLVKTGQKIDPENYLGWTPLMMAVRNANCAIVTFLLDHKADATKMNKFGMNTFLISVSSGDIDLVEKILNHLLCGGISRQSLQKIFSPISLSIMFNQSNIFRYLIERSFDINASTLLTGITPLMFAAAVSNLKAYKKLTQQKADPTLKNYVGKTASEILKIKDKRVDIGNTFQKPKTPDVPIIIVSPHTGPNLQLTPCAYPCASNGITKLRKSSNIHTPITNTPNLSPITTQFLAQNVRSSTIFTTPVIPHFFPQMFFPPNFSPSQFVSPGIGYNYSFNSNDFLNAAVVNHTPVFSPN